MLFEMIDPVKSPDHAHGYRCPCPNLTAVQAGAHVLAVSSLCVLCETSSSAGSSERSGDPWVAMDEGIQLCWTSTRMQGNVNCDISIVVREEDRVIVEAAMEQHTL